MKIGLDQEKYIRQEKVVAWEWIISCNSNFTLTLHLWIIIVKSAFIISDNAIHTF